jgi:hypothetical protein
MIAHLFEEFLSEIINLIQFMNQQSFQHLLVEKSPNWIMSRTERLRYQHNIYDLINIIILERKNIISHLKRFLFYYLSYFTHY